jgi:hypothetical protein
VGLINKKRGSKLYSLLGLAIVIFLGIFLIGSINNNSMFLFGDESLGLNFQEGIANIYLGNVVGVFGAGDPFVFYDAFATEINPGIYNTVPITANPVDNGGITGGFSVVNGQGVLNYNTNGSSVGAMGNIGMKQLIGDFSAIVYINISNQTPTYNDNTDSAFGLLFQAGMTPIGCEIHVSQGSPYTLKITNTSFGSGMVPVSALAEKVEGNLSFYYDAGLLNCSFHSFADGNSYSTTLTDDAVGAINGTVGLTTAFNKLGGPANSVGSFYADFDNLHVSGTEAAAPAPPAPPTLTDFLEPFNGGVINGAVFGAPFIEKNLAVTQNNVLQIGGTTNGAGASANLATTGTVNTNNNTNLSADIVFTSTVAGDPVTVDLLINAGAAVIGCSVSNASNGVKQLCTLSSKGPVCQAVTTGIGNLKLLWDAGTSGLTCQFDGQVAVVTGVTKPVGGTIMMRANVPTSGDTVQYNVDNLDLKMGPIGVAPPPAITYLVPFIDNLAGVGLNLSFYVSQATDGILVAKDDKIVLNGTANKDVAVALVKTLSFLNMSTAFNASVDINVTAQNLAAGQKLMGSLIKPTPDPRGCSVDELQNGDFQLCALSNLAPVCVPVSKGNGTLKFLWDPNTHVTCQFDGQIASKSGVTSIQHNSLQLQSQLTKNGDSGGLIFDNLNLEINPNAVIIPPTVPLLPFLEEFTGGVTNTSRFSVVETGGLSLVQNNNLAIGGNANKDGAIASLDTLGVLNIASVFNVSVDINLIGTIVNTRVAARLRDNGAVNKNGCQVEVDDKGDYQLCVRFGAGQRGSCVSVPDGQGRLTYLWNPAGGQIYCILDGVQTSRFGITGGAGPIVSDLVAGDNGDQASVVFDNLELTYLGGMPPVQGGPCASDVNCVSGELCDGGVCRADCLGGPANCTASQACYTGQSRSVCRTFLNPFTVDFAGAQINNVFFPSVTEELGVTVAQNEVLTISGTLDGGDGGVSLQTISVIDYSESFVLSVDVDQFSFSGNGEGNLDLRTAHGAEEVYGCILWQNSDGLELCTSLPDELSDTEECETVESTNGTLVYSWDAEFNRVRCDFDNVTSQVYNLGNPNITGVILLSGLGDNGDTVTYVLDDLKLQRNVEIEAPPVPETQVKNFVVPFQAGDSLIDTGDDDIKVYLGPGDMPFFVYTSYYTPTFSAGGSLRLNGANNKATGTFGAVYRSGVSYYMPFQTSVDVELKDTSANLVGSTISIAGLAILDVDGGILYEAVVTENSQGNYVMFLLDGNGIVDTSALSSGTGLLGFSVNDQDQATVTFDGEVIFTFSDFGLSNGYNPSLFYQVIDTQTAANTDGLIDVYFDNWNFMVQTPEALDCSSLDQGQCETHPYCYYRQEGEYGFCEEEECSDLTTQNSCSDAQNQIGKTCDWDVSTSSFDGWCEMSSCYSFEGTNENTCVNNAEGLICDWNEECSGWNEECWGVGDSSTCNSMDGCFWGMCQEKGCWDYGTASTCEVAGNKGSRGGSCKWNGGSNYCYEDSCWDITTKAACEASAMNCEYDDTYNMCSEISCSSYDFTSKATCESAEGLTCSYDLDVERCRFISCWDKNEAACGSAAGCSWQAVRGDTGGECRDVDCWDLTTRGTCEAQDECVFDAIRSQCSRGEAKTCGAFVNEMDCLDTYHCFWDYENVECKDPSDNSYTSIFSAWSPGCYIFNDATSCAKVSGCAYDESDGCITQVGHANEAAINADGLSCSQITNLDLCTSISALSTCCDWVGTGCVDSFDPDCRLEEEEMPQGMVKCSDASAVTSDIGSAEVLCNQVSGSPWYAACKWDSSVGQCKFDGDSVFGDRTQSLTMIDNPKMCTTAGGKWIDEFYCETSGVLGAAVSVPAGRCEAIGDEQTNCNEACFACENNFDGSSHNSVAVAKEYCFDSDLGFCEFVEDSTAPNGFGFCGAKEEFKVGIATDCKTDCGSCTYTGNTLASSPFDGSEESYFSCNTPQCYCENADTFGTVSCKYISDSSSDWGGYCTDSTTKTCHDSCDRCYERDSCVNDGKTVWGVSGLCEWSGTDADGSCIGAGGSNDEICWDAIDNDENGDIDCEDSKCFSDPSCGFVSGDCPSYATVATCEAAGCEAVEDFGGFFCDFAGGRCWENDGNPSACAAAGCDFSTGAGTAVGVCEQDWGEEMTCMEADDEDACGGLDGCLFETDDWCNTPDGAVSEWCADGKGGWCKSEAFSNAEVECWRYKAANTCNAQDGCVFMSSEFGEVCEVDWGVNCQSYSDGSTCISNGCDWAQEGEFSWCRGKFESCFGSNENQCLQKTDTCAWNNWNNNCEPVCFSLANGACTEVNGCVLTSGWCEQDWSGSGLSCYDLTEEAPCNSADGCTYKGAGWCNPPGFTSGGEHDEGIGGGGESGSGCWQYDGTDQTSCESNVAGSECSWHVELNSYCDVDWSDNCWENWNSGDCNGQDSCSWNSDGSNCESKFDSCWQIQDGSTCNTNVNCDYNEDYSSCEPICFSLNSADCAANSACKSMSGWCESPGMGAMFDGMESGMPMMIATDDCGSETSDHVDICGIGLKDMGDAFGFAAPVDNMLDAGVCNNQKVGYAGVQMGQGDEDVKLYVYIDSDDSTIGGCALSNDNDQKGYEFMLKYDSTWNADTSKAEESFTSYKCSSSKWVVADIGLSAWSKKMCSEIGGPMIAVQKSDLEKFPTLYNSGVDMRVYVATAAEGKDASTPSDTAGPGWVTPGSIDFELAGFFEYGADSAKFEDIMKKGYVEYEDCFNDVDDDDDGTVDCLDWDCAELKVCENLGVNAGGYVDNSAPKISGIKIEEYTDAAMIMYYSNKPTTGSLSFYSTDASCTGSATEVYDTGVISDDVLDYKMWHIGELYNDGGVNSLDSALTQDTDYYYKLEICDKSGKCAKSKCSKLRTSNGRCPYCNFVTKISAPTGWTVSYDLDTDGTYEHEQGNVCGENAGMKTNYTDGRSANVMLSDANGYKMIFNNVHLTKTGLTSDTRDIQSAGSLIATTVNDVPLVGMASGTRDKIINNLYPETCQIRIPTPDDCDELWHCDDNGANCINRDDATLVLDESSSGFCTWQIPYCEFSTWAGGDAGVVSSSSSDDSSASGGASSSASGGGSFTSDDEEEEIEESGADEEDSSFLGISDFNIKPLEFKTPSVEGNDWFFELYGLWITCGILCVMFILYVVVSKPKK